MFDMGFEPQVMKIVNNIRPDRQTVLFSATFPKQMEALARKVLEKPVEIQVSILPVAYSCFQRIRCRSEDEASSARTWNSTRLSWKSIRST